MKRKGPKGDGVMSKYSGIAEYLSQTSESASSKPGSRFYLASVDPVRDRACHRLLDALVRMKVAGATREPARHTAGDGSQITAGVTTDD